MSIGIRIKAARRRKGMRQKHVADALQLDQSTISAWERDVSGEKPGPRIEHVVQMADLFGVDFSWLAVGVGQGPAAEEAA